MAGRTFAIGDIHGDIDALRRLIQRLPALDAKDTLVFVGDYVDRGPCSAEVVDLVRRELPRVIRAKIVALRGNHEDGWLRVASGGWPQFVIPAPNGCVATLRSFTGAPHGDGDGATKDELEQMLSARFFPKDVLAWMNGLPFFYEDEHAIYVHAGLVRENNGANGEWLHPSRMAEPAILLWVRTMDFFRNYVGKRVVCGHTSTEHLPPELSSFTPEDPTDMWVNGSVLAIDTGCGKGGFLTAVELPEVRVYESR